jgi:hypothetical protein
LVEKFEGNKCLKDVSLEVRITLYKMDLEQAGRAVVRWVDEAQR